MFDISKIKSNFYTKGKFGKRFRETLDTHNQYLYSRGHYPTKIKKEDLPEDYIEFKSRVIWYMTGYLKTSGIVDINYRPMEMNHLFKDDYLYISYSAKLITEKNNLGSEDYVNYDICICGNDIIPILIAIEKYSNIDTNEVRRKIQDKVEWYRINCEEDYIRLFGNRKIDIFKFYEELEKNIIKKFVNKGYNKFDNSN